MDAKETAEHLEDAIVANHNDDILKFFRFKHLGETQAGASMIFAHAAVWTVNNVGRQAERTAGLRKLLEAKDCVVRCTLGMP